MARQASSPVKFNRSLRSDNSVTMTSGRAGKVVPIGYLPLFPGDSASGKVGIDVQLAEMPRPILNAVTANLQAWFVPKSAHPQFASREELQSAWTGDVIKTLGYADRTPPPYFYTVTAATRDTVLASEFYKALGIHCGATGSINADLIDAFSLIYNFRLAAHSSRLTRRKYLSESAALATVLPPAFWPSARFANVVPDYEKALVVGSLDLDVIAGRLPVSGIGWDTSDTTGVTTPSLSGREATNVAVAYAASVKQNAAGVNAGLLTRAVGTGASLRADVWAEMAGQALSVSLNDLDKARTTQAFAKMRAAYNGNDTTGFGNDDSIVAMMMQGLSVPPDDYKRPWLLDSKRVPVGFAERFATDGASLSNSVTLGRAAASLSINVPEQQVGGMIIFTVEVLPERLDERMQDEYLIAAIPNDLPNALRDIQRVEPVDLVLNRRIDAKHTVPAGLYGYEPMNDKWNRNFTRLGGAFYQATPGAPYSQQRAAIWQTDLVDPAFGTSHYLAPVTFPHLVFSDTLAAAFEVVCRHSVRIAGLTQIGDVLAENSDDFLAVTTEGIL